MKRAIIVVTVMLVLSLIAMAVVFGFGELGRSSGQEWGSLNGPQPTWPAAVGFGAMNLAALSGAILVLLVGIALVRELTRSRRVD